MNQANARLFVALPLPDHAKNFIHHWRQDQLPDHGATWVIPENFHVTLAFIGPKPRQDIPDIIDYASEQMDLGLLPFQWQINRVSHFRAGVLYLSGWNTPYEMTHLAHSLEFFIPSSARHPNFIPHITLARNCPHHLTGDIELDVTFSDVVLFESSADDDGVRYHAVHRWST